jgi:hypothetical protein
MRNPRKIRKIVQAVSSTTINDLPDEVGVTFYIKFQQKGT